MLILISKHIYNEIVSHCTERLPNEACGVLIGAQSASRLIVERFVPLPNTSRQPTLAFEIDHSTWIQLLFDCRKAGLHIVGIVHSHPTSSAIPSPADVRTEWHTIPSHWILSYMNKESPILRAFSFHADETYELVDWDIQLE